MIWIKKLILSAIAITSAAIPGSSACLRADTTGRPILSVYSVEIGAQRNLSTYLSPLYYDGASYGLSGSWTKDFNHWPDRCEMQFEAGLDFQDLLSPAGNSQMLAMTGRFGWGLSWKKMIARDWKLTVGPMVDIYGGALYLPRNGNNPVTALVSAGIDAAASVNWKTHFGRMPVIIGDEIRIPTLSAFFCPQYGESYYEIWLGNRSGLAHCGWWGNAFGLNNLLSLKMNLGKTGLQVGYRFDLRYFKANSLETQLLKNAIVIGVIPGSF